MKFNEVAIFSIENEEATFEDYMKKNIKFNIGLDQICLARIGLCKVIKKKIDSIKNDPAIVSWKNTFIQYRSRFEKRKCWKEKQKSILSIEKSLIIENLDVDMEKEIEQTEEKTTQDDPVIPPDEVLKENFEPVKEPLVVAEKNFEKVKPKKLATKTEVNTFVRPSENLKKIVLEKEAEFVPEKKTSEMVEAKKKDIFVEKRPSYMVVQQFNLEESKNSEEIILEPSTFNMDNDEVVKKDTNQIVNDPFFLDKNGNEIINDNEDNYRDSYSRDYSNRSYDNTRDFSYNRYDNSRNFTRNSENVEKSYGYDRFQNRSSSYNKSSDKPNFSSTRPTSNRGYDDKSNFSRPKPRTQYDNIPRQPAKSMDVSKLHPSWQAKKEMEEKTKVKFEGKKKTFSDD